MEPMNQRPPASFAASLRTRSWLAPEAVDRVQSRALVAGGGGIALCALGFATGDRGQFFQSYLVAYQFWLGIALGCFAISMLHHLTGGAWGLVVRRVLEAASRTLPALLLLFVPLLFGLPDLYVWGRPAAVAADAALQRQRVYLNPGAFIARLLVYFLLWIAFAWVLSRLSRRQDETADPGLARRMQVVSAPGLALYALAATFASFDWLMSLDPSWSSTIYGVYFLGGHGLAGFAFLILVAVFLAAREPMSGVLAGRHFHDYGKLMFAFVMLWAYFAFSQFLIIWSGNIPHEISYYLNRTRHGWQWIALAVILGHFALPFVLLLSRPLKLRAGLLAKVAALVLVMRWVDLYWQVAPTFHPQSILPHWLDAAAFVALGGLWISLFARELKRRPLLPVNAPELEEAVGDA
jgi:hypothetical protein